MTGVRPFQATDLALLAGLHAACFADAWNEATLSELLASPGVFALLAGRGKGFVLARAVASEAEILSIAVLPGCRRKGLACRLLSAAAIEAKRRGANKLFLEVASDNGPALALYRQAGFAKVGQRAGYYHRPEGAVAAEVLALDLVKAESNESYCSRGIQGPETQ
jgi:[ribosomal protein S18]-alanine N-acetyltransferase